MAIESRLPVGSSAKRILGSFTIDRATDTRCCCPPESIEGTLCDTIPTPKRSSNDWARRFRVTLSALQKIIGKATLSMTDNEGIKLND